MSKETHIVGFRVGRATYGVPITSLHEIVRVPEITAMPDAPDYLEGVINLRGKIVSVVDLRKRFGQPSGALDRRNRILVVEHRGRLAGMIVDSASEVLKIPESEIEAAPLRWRHSTPAGWSAPPDRRSLQRSCRCCPPGCRARRWSRPMRGSSY